jgi:hypothetical protein
MKKILFIAIAFLAIQFVLAQETANDTDNLVYNSAGLEKKPEFPEGIKEFHKFLKKNYKPSPEAKGLAFVTFIIEKDGSLSNFKLLRDPGFGAGEEALRVLSICPKWSPGETKGEKVRCVFSTSIPYREPIKTITKRISE